MSDGRHYHLIGIGGTAMASLAGLLRAKGHRVTGSDANVYPPMSTQLQSQGIPYAEGYRPENLDPVPDVVVIGNAISRGNAELEAVLDRRLYYTSAAQTIKEEFLRGKHVLAVAGTHGKTTTTSLVAWLMESAGLNPSFLIGGVAENFGTSFRLTDSEFFVIEADEYDTAYFDKGPKMWHYLPHTAIVNNIEFDHADIYRDEEAYLFAFARFINLVPRTGTLIAGWDSALARRLAGKSLAPVESFGFAPPVSARSADAEDRAEVPAAAERAEVDGVDAAPRWSARNVRFDPDATRFEVLHDGEAWGEVTTPLAGAFNVRNSLAAIAACVAAGADPARLREGLASFRSVRRRLELRGEVAGVTMIDDFAHHPTAVRETVEAVRQRYPGRRLVAVFEPRSYTAQRREFQEPYTRALGIADSVVLAGLFHPERYTAESGLNPEALVGDVVSGGTPAWYIPGADDIVTHLTERLEPGDVVLIMSNGGFGGLQEKLLAALEARG